MPEIGAFLYAEDCVVSARLELEADRLTDFLNASESIALRQVTVYGHADGRVVELDSLTLARDEVLAAEATGPRGVPQRRVRTRQSRLEVALGPYRVLGLLHGPPAAEPIGALMRRPTMVPLTSATVEYRVAGETIARNAGTIIVNRDRVESIRIPKEADLSDVSDLLLAEDPQARHYNWVAYAYRAPNGPH